ncbi:MAG: sensor histidine kinase [Verrucomicrobia bacterium]|nr:sensor histidine kinase [Verrucomicrobiota bacterium]
MQASFKFSPEILVRLGEELVPNPTDGLLELVKNAYDADASKCTIKVTKKSVRIEDDGDGMSDTDIVEGWLLIGGSRKDATTPTTKGRTPVGNKGLGRLAALRLGTKVSLTSRPRGQLGKEFKIEVDWREVDQSEYVEQKRFTISETATTKSPGTEILLEDLKETLSEVEVARLSRSLVLLSDPFENQAGFYPFLKAEGFAALAKLAKQNYFDDADFHLQASVDSGGNPTVAVLDWQDRVMYAAKPEYFKKKVPYRTPPAIFDLWVFKLANQSFSAKNSDLKDVREWLRVVGGVHLYQSNIRVRPFGEPGHDWLGMNLKRVGSPEERPSTNNSVGQIKVNDLGQLLTQKTDRSGFVENDAFRELKRFAVDCLDWMATRRLATAETRRELKRSSTSASVVAAKENVEDLIRKKVPKKAQGQVMTAFKKFDSAKQQETVALKEDLQLYRSVATAGSTSAVFAHESHKPLSQILGVTASIKHRAKELLGDLFGKKLEEPIDFLTHAAKSLQLFSQLPLNLLKREKRRNEVVDVTSSAKELVGYLKPFFGDAKIDLQFTPSESPVMVAGSRALVESIMANMALNGLKAFDAPDARIVGRTVELRVYPEGTNAVIKVLDNGPGIRNIALDEIWLPGRTTFPGGTGFGLTIVRDSVSDLHGTQGAVANGQLGGAEFTITIPLSN